MNPNGSTLPILPQHAASIGLRGSDGAAGAAGAPGPPGPAGASGSFTLVTATLTAAQIATLNVPTAIQLTADMPGVLQVIVSAGFEINKTHLTGAGAVPSWQLVYNTVGTLAMSLGAMDLGNTRNFGSWTEQSSQSFVSGSVGVPPGVAGRGISTVWSATYAPSTFSTSA